LASGSMEWLAEQQKALPTAAPAPCLDPSWISTELVGGRGLNLSPSSREVVSRGNSPFLVEKPGFSAGVRAGASAAVGRDAQGAATSGQRAVIYGRPRQVVPTVLRSIGKYVSPPRICTTP
jgi:hypothetical protein